MAKTIIHSADFDVFNTRCQRASLEVLNLLNDEGVFVTLVHQESAFGLIAVTGENNSPLRRILL